MKKHLSTITILFAAIIMVLLIGCNRYPEKFGVNVGRSDTGHYNDVHLNDGDTISWVPTVNHCCYVESEGKYFHYHEEDTVRTAFIACDSWSYGTIIGGHVVDFLRDEKYLLVDQKPIDSILGKEIIIYDNNGNYKQTIREFDNVHNYQWDAYEKWLEESPAIHQYWILVINTADVYGPFSYEDYLDMKQKLGVPPTLMLKCEKEENINK